MATLLEEIFSTSDKEWTEEDLESVRLANILIRDLDLTPETLDNELVTQENAIGESILFGSFQSV